LASQTYFSWQELDIQITKSNLPGNALSNVAAVENILVIWLAKPIFIGKDWISK
jgi:hypothetical protein